LGEEEMNDMRDKKMSEHESIREMLPLAAAAALNESEQRALKQHLAACADCAAEMENWNALAIGLQRLPTPQAPALLVERTRTRVTAEMAAVAERRSSHWGIALLVLFAWTVTLGTWPIVRLFTDGLLSWLDWGFNQTWFGLATYAAVVWVTAGVAAAMLGLRKHREGRLV
jgi:anti-sigma factor RsiW